MNMGFFSTIGNFVSGAISTVGRCIGGAIKTAVGSLAHVARTVGGSLGGIIGKAAGLLGRAASIVAGPLGPILGPIVTQIIIEVAARVIERIAQELGSIDKDDKVEEVGYRLEEAGALDDNGQLKHPEWKRPEDFDNLHDYYAYLKQMVPDESIDYGKMKQNRLRYVTVGTAGLTEGWSQRMGIAITDSFILTIGRANLRQGEITAIVNAFKGLGFSSVELEAFLRGNGLSISELNRIREAIISSYQALYPNKTTDDIRLRIQEWRRAVCDDAAVGEQYKDWIQDIQSQADQGLAPEDIDFHHEPSYTKDMK